jgi:hypothetical protein
LLIISITSQIRYIIRLNSGLEMTRITCPRKMGKLLAKIRHCRWRSVAHFTPCAEVVLLCISSVIKEESSFQRVLVPGVCSRERGKLGTKFAIGDGVFGLMEKGRISQRGQVPGVCPRERGKLGTKFAIGPLGLCSFFIVVAQTIWSP